jgi:hypothetical protein
VECGVHLCVRYDREVVGVVLHRCGVCQDEIGEFQGVGVGPEMQQPLIPAYFHGWRCQLVVVHGSNPSFLESVCIECSLLRPAWCHERRFWHHAALILWFHVGMAVSTGI